MTHGPPHCELDRLFAMQRAAVTYEGPPRYAERIAGLDALLGMLRRSRSAWVDAINADFGNRSVTETELGELMPLFDGIGHTRRKLRSWMRPQRRRAGIAFRPAHACVMHQPLGVVGVISPWNYPLLLTLGPLVDALAAGNRVMLKPSELTPRTSALLKRQLGEIFPETRVAVVLGDAQLAAGFAALPFDHLLFTGSTQVGARVMAAAASHLTPVTLELGGKSPAVVCRDYPLDRAARRIAIGKLFSAGQTCVAPDYAMVPADRVEEFAAAFMTAARTLYPTLADNSDYTSIISESHHRRLLAMLDEARACGARIFQTGDASVAQRKFPPTVVIGAPETCALMREEVFGPILPVVPYDDLPQTLAWLNTREKPLALYCFSTDRHSIATLRHGTNSGGFMVNGTLLHVAQADLPFGGVGASGMGAYHGRDGFLRFSHARAVLSLGRFNVSDRIAAPYGKLARLATRLLVRRNRSS